MTPDDLLVYLKEIVPYMKEMGRDRLRDLLHLIIKDITIIKPQSPDEKWEIKISPWSYDPRAYFLDVLTSSCYRPSLLRISVQNTNFYGIPLQSESPSFYPTARLGLSHSHLLFGKNAHHFSPKQILLNN